MLGERLQANREAFKAGKPLKNNGVPSYPKKARFER